MVSGKRLAVLGFAFKDTNDTRESPAISVCKSLLDEQARLAIYDPKVEANQIFADLEVKSDDPRIELCSSALQATHGAHGVLVLTEWDEFRDLDFAKVYQDMQKPAWIFDGRNVLDMAKLKSLGFTCIALESHIRFRWESRPRLGGSIRVLRHPLRFFEDLGRSHRRRQSARVTLLSIRSSTWTDELPRLCFPESSRQVPNR
jgi:hypothetical protein